MKDGIILETDWQYNYWEKEMPGQYTKSDFRTRPGWEDYRKSCPLPALGMYTGRYKDYKFDYLMIKEIKLNEIGEPHFDYEFLAKSSTRSEFLDLALPKRNQRFFHTLSNQELRLVISKLKENPPKTWVDLLGGQFTPGPSVSVGWEEYVGRYFLEMNQPSLSNQEFEDRVADLLTAIGFDVLQKGHRLEGEYPDGVASYAGEFALVYDCKNAVKYFPSAEHIRALEKYYKDEKIVTEKHRQLFCGFIAKSFDTQNQKNAYLISTEALLYLLYKKLSLGARFNLKLIKKILVNRSLLTKELIDKEWSVSN
jgi:hypothetical protein